MSGYLSVLGAASDVIQWYWSSSNPEKPLDVKQIAINPIIAMTQLALLYHHPEGTKFDFSNHQIVFFEPNVSQGVQRKKNGSSRDVVLKLKPLIATALQWYQPYENAKVQRIFTRTIRGLKVLKKTYKDSDIVKECIDGYIKSIAEACLKNIPRVEPTNNYQKRVFEKGWIEIERLTEILSEFPGDSGIFEFDQKLEKELYELQKQGVNGTLNTSRTSLSEHHETINQDVKKQVHADIPIEEQEEKLQIESSSSQAADAAMKSSGSNKKGVVGKKTQKSDKTPSTADQTQNRALEKREPISIDHSEASEPSILPAEHNSDVNSSSTLTAEQKASKIRAIKEQQDKFYTESLRKLIDEDVVPHAPSGEKMSKITAYLEGEVTDLSKIVHEEVVNLLLFK